MILPTKRLGDCALLLLGAEVICLLGEPKTVSRIWHELKNAPHHKVNPASLTYDWYVLALDLLYSLGVIDFEGGRLRRVV